MLHRRDILRHAAAIGAALAAPWVCAQPPWPDKPVRIVVLFPAGGAADTLTRMLAPCG